MAQPDDTVTVLLPEDEYPHVPDAAGNYNESMYLNAFDLEREMDRRALPTGRASIPCVRFLWWYGHGARSHDVARVHPPGR